MANLTHNNTTHRFLIVDDHEAILAGVVPGLQRRYPNAEIVTAQDVETAERELSDQRPTFVIVDLILPAMPQTMPSAQAGIRLLEQLIHSELAPSLMVLSINIRPLIRLKSVINAYQGGFVALDKSAPLQSILNTVDIALRGSIYLPPEVRSRPEFDRRWLQVLVLKYEEGLSDRAISQVMGISDRTVRNYWNRIQDALNVYDDPQKDLRLQIQQAARKAGLIA
ncbi:MAG: response regulator transcription factor [Cyanobacteria bacterium P01_D01_bin.36]